MWLLTFPGTCFLQDTPLRAYMQGTRRRLQVLPGIWDVRELHRRMRYPSRLISLSCAFPTRPSRKLSFNSGIGRGSGYTLRVHSPWRCLRNFTLPAGYSIRSRPSANNLLLPGRIIPSLWRGLRQKYQDQLDYWLPRSHHMCMKWTAIPE